MHFLKFFPIAIMNEFDHSIPLIKDSECPGALLSLSEKRALVPNCDGINLY
jgi:hypothetical protein